jgi:hypothetical protein
LENALENGYLEKRKADGRVRLRHILRKYAVTMEQGVFNQSVTTSDRQIFSNYH